MSGTAPLREAFSQLQNMVILYVEDDIAAREEISFFLEDKVHKLYQANDGSEGLTFFQQNSEEIDIVITDIQMPKMNGLEMATQIKLLSPETPIIITSAFNDNDYLFKAIEVGINHYVTKPIDLMQLIQKLASIAQIRNMQKSLEQTRKSLEYYQKAIDTRMLLTRSDKDGKIIYVNDRLSSMTGYKPEELKDESERILWHPEEIQEGKYEKFFENLYQKQYHQDIILYRTKAGEKLIVDLTAFAILNDAEEIEGYIFIRNDITELINYRKLLEQRLNVNQKNLREKMHFLNEYQKALDLGTALCRMDPSGTITYANHTFTSLLQYKGEDIIGENYFAICQFENSINNPQLLRQNIYEKRVYNASVIYKTVTNKNVYLSSAYIPIFNIDHEIIEIVCIHHDMTEIIELHQELDNTQKELIYTLGEVTENRSNETGNHIKRVAEYSALLAKYAGYEQEIETIKIASTMHDIGKIAIEDTILKKPGKLTDEEIRRMKEHAIIGYNIFKKSSRPILQAAAVIARDHHEKWDGTGYPQGLKGEEIHPYGRIVALADVFDALGSDRVYKKAWEPERIYALFRQERGKHFEPKLVDIFFEHLDAFLQIKERFQD